jgi:peptidoglycan/LPS O-acetylase OafA/YrhL
MAPRRSERSPQGFRADVQGLRAVAVGLVILYHYNLLGVTGGYVGVDVFFVISGFVIAGLLFRELAAHGRVSFADFYARRARRILPASATTLVVTVIAAVFLFGRVGAYSIAQDAVAAALFVANFHFAAQGTNYFANSLPPSPILHFWSLAVEEQFYFVFPSLVAVVGLVSPARAKRRNVVVVVSLIVVGTFVWSILETSSNPTTAYYSILTRAWELGVGVIVAGIVHRFAHLRASVALAATTTGAVMILWSAWALNSVTAYPGAVAAVPVAGAALLILGGATSEPAGVSWLLGTRPFVAVGDLSYSLYLWHFPVIALASQYYGGSLSLARRLALLALAVGLSVASFVVIEQPLRSSKGLRRLPARSLAVGALCVALAVGVALIPLETVTVTRAKVVTGHPALAQLRREVAAGLRLRQLPASVDPALSPLLPITAFGIPRMIEDCNSSTYVTNVPLCSFGDVHSRTTVVLYGNSQAQMWAPALDLLGRELHFRLVPIAKPACGTFVDSGYIGPNGRVSPVCGQFVHWAVRKMISLHPSEIVVATTPGLILRPGANPNQLQANGRLPASSIMSPTPERTAADFQRLVADLAPSGAGIALLGAIPLTYVHPVAGQTPTGCLLANQRDVQRCTVVEPTTTNNFWSRSFALASADTGVALVNPDPLLCEDGRCPPLIADVIVRFDQLHLTGPFVRYAARALGELMVGDLPGDNSPTTTTTQRP